MVGINVKEMIYMYFVSLFQLLLGTLGGSGVSVVVEWRPDVISDLLADE